MGRKDEQVKIRGYRIELGEIEAVLQEHAEVEAAVVVAHETAGGEKELVAYVVGREGLRSTELRAHAGRRLPGYMVPGHYVQLTELPRTASGKVDRKKLPSPEGMGMGSGVAYVAPRNATEERLVEIWQEILGKERIGIRDDFFELGGHSLKATRLIEQIKKEFKIEIALRNVFQEPMIEVLSDTINNNKWFRTSRQEDAEIYDEIKI
jgi:acyl carrier protein